jgi:8-amino-7-oxononanoate synthase
VPQGTARLRVTLCAGHSEDDVAQLINALKRAITSLPERLDD